MTYRSRSEKETQKIAGDLATKIIKSHASLKPRMASIIALEGELGAGKTTFVKGFAKALGIKAKVKSPTFTLMKEYKFPSLKRSQNTNHKTQINSKFKISNSKHLVHLDCYRVRDHRDLATLDLKTIFNESHNIVLIEWSERISKILPKKLIRVHIDHIDENKRKITIYNYSNF